MNAHRDNDGSGATPMDQAEAWFARLRDDAVDAAAMADFAVWLDADSGNKAAFDAVTDRWHNLGRILQSSTDLSAPTDANVSPLRTAATPDASFKPTWFRPMALAATILLGAGLLLVTALTNPTDQIQLSTVIGEQRSADLSDGSLITANTDTAVSGTFSSHERQFELTQGEAYFAVAADPERPFSVTAGGLTATALGTAFSVQLSSLPSAASASDRAAEVVVAEGRVEVVAGGERLVVGANQRANFVDGVLTAQAIAADDALAWREGRLVYIDVSLQELVTDLNRYLPRPMAVSDDSLRAERVSAVLEISDQASMLDALAHVLPLQWNVVSDSLVLISPVGP